MDSTFPITDVVPLKSTLSYSKAPSKYKLRPTTNGHHPQSWIITFNIPARSSCCTTTNTLRYCSCSSSFSFTPVFIFVYNSSSCNSVLKPSATSLNCAFNNTACIYAPGSITRPTAGGFILSKSNTAFCNKPIAIVGSLCLTATRRFILFWSRITSIVGGGLQAAALATARECASERSVNNFYSELKFQYVNRSRNFSFGLGSDPQCSCMDCISFFRFVVS